MTSCRVTPDAIWTTDSLGDVALFVLTTNLQLRRLAVHALHTQLLRSALLDRWSIAVSDLRSHIHVLRCLRDVGLPAACHAVHHQQRRAAARARVGRLLRCGRTRHQHVDRAALRRRQAPASLRHALWEDRNAAAAVTEREDSEAAQARGCDDAEDHKPSRRVD